MFHGWRFDPDGDQAAADSTRSSASFGTGRSVNPRTARRLMTASYTSMIAHLLLVNAPQRLGRGRAPTDTGDHLRGSDRSLFKRMRSSSSALTQQAVSTPRGPVPNERRRRR